MSAGLRSLDNANKRTAAKVSPDTDNRASAEKRQERVGRSTEDGGGQLPQQRGGRGGRGETRKDVPEQRGHGAERHGATPGQRARLTLHAREAEAQGTPGGAAAAAGTGGGQRRTRATGRQRRVVFVSLIISCCVYTSILEYSKYSVMAVLVLRCSESKFAKYS